MPLPTEFQNFIHTSRYARWSDELGRRETWEETVDRYINFMCDVQLPGKIPADTRKELRDAILGLEVMPSMRGLMTAGPALAKDPSALFNCSGLLIDCVEAFDEMLYLLMVGSGVGFSVERQFIVSLPTVAPEVRKSKTVIKVEDSRIGWANALRELMTMLYAGRIPEWDLSELRPAGAKLKTFGGRSSGPGPLDSLFKFVVATFKGAAGRKLNSIECHDICCKIAEVVVSGGTRRCIPAGTRVSTTRGFVKIEDIVVGDRVITPVGTETVLASGFSGKKEIIVITTPAGDFKCTEDHKIAVLTDFGKYVFKAAKDVTINDTLVWSDVPAGGVTTALPPYIPFRYTEVRSSSYKIRGKDKGVCSVDECSNPACHFGLCNAHYTRQKSYGDTKYSKEREAPISIPKLDEGTAWLLGFTQGDGHVRYMPYIGKRTRRGWLSYPVAKDGFHDSFCARIVEQLGRWSSTPITRYQYTGYEVLTLKSVALAQYFYENVKQAKQPLRVPEFIFSSPAAVRSAFLAGIFDADGSCRTRPVSLCCTIYKDFAEDLRRLCASLGLLSYIRIQRVKPVKWKTKYVLCVRGLTSRQLAEKLLLPHSIKYVATEKRKSGTACFSYPGKWLLPRGCQYDRISVLRAEELGKDTTYRGLCVLSVARPEETADTYDISVNRINQFVADGLVVHNSATISLSNPSDDRMRYAKSGQWYDTAPWRAMANNSAVYTEKPDMTVWFKEWMALYESKSGERGIVNREAIKQHITKLGRRDPNHEFVVNPCAEAILRVTPASNGGGGGGLCNLSEVYVRESDDEDSLRRKLRLATIIGTMQASVTSFRYLRPKWKEVADEEALLGVSLSGVMDNQLMSGKKGRALLNQTLERLRDYVITVNEEWAPVIGVKPSVSATCCKPSGTCALLCNTAAGIHPRFSEYYIRTVRGSMTDPVTKLLMAEGVPWEPDVTKPDVQVVFSFPVKAPEGCTTVDDVSSVEQLELWRSYRNHWCSHQPSVTIYVKDDEWMRVGSWVYDHFSEVGGLSFLPKSSHSYQQAPYQEITKAEYETALAKMPRSINWVRLAEYEKEDSSVGSRELACSGGACELVDLTPAQ